MNTDDLLDELASLGFSWTGIARLVGVSIPALRKWRQGEAPSGENRRRLAQIVAFVGVLEQDHLITDVASWLDVPLAGTSHTGLDLFASGNVGDLLEYAAQKLDSTELLDRTVPGWRDELTDQYEVFEAGDGERAIRFKERPSAHRLEPECPHEELYLEHMRPWLGGTLVAVRRCTVCHRTVRRTPVEDDPPSRFL